MLDRPAMMIAIKGNTGRYVDILPSRPIPTAPTKAKDSPHTAQMTQYVDGDVPALTAPASIPRACTRKLAAEKVKTACQPICRTPINRPGMRMPPWVPKVEEPTTYRFMPV